MTNIKKDPPPPPPPNYLAAQFDNKVWLNKLVDITRTCNKKQLTGLV